MKTFNKYDLEIIESLPFPMSPVDIVNYLELHEIDSDYANSLYRLVACDDVLICDWLNITRSKLNKFLANKHAMDKKAQEHVLLLLGVHSTGIQVFETKASFGQWLNTPLSCFDGLSRTESMTSILGVSFVLSELLFKLDIKRS